MTWFWSYLLYGIPWPVQLAIIAVPCILAFYVAVRVFGWERVKVWVAPAIAVLAAFGLLSRQRQQGYTDRRAEEEKALDHAEAVVVEEQAEVRKMPDQEIDKEVDKWSRH